MLLPGLRWGLSPGRNRDKGKAKGAPPKKKKAGPRERKVPRAAPQVSRWGLLPCRAHLPLCSAPTPGLLSLIPVLVLRAPKRSGLDRARRRFASSNWWSGTSSGSWGLARPPCSSRGASGSRTESPLPKEERHPSWVGLLGGQVLPLGREERRRLTQAQVPQHCVGGRDMGGRQAGALEMLGPLEKQGSRVLWPDHPCREEGVVSALPPRLAPKVQKGVLATQSLLEEAQEGERLLGGGGGGGGSGSRHGVPIAYLASFNK